MANITMDDIKQFLREHTYIVEARQTNNGCLLSFPQAELLNKNGEKIDIVFEKGAKCGVRYSNKNDSRFIETEEYVVSVRRLITKSCELFGYSTELIDYYDAYGESITETEFDNTLGQ